MKRIKSVIISASLASALLVGISGFSFAASGNYPECCNSSKNRVNTEHRGLSDQDLGVGQFNDHG